MSVAIQSTHVFGPKSCCLNAPYNSQTVIGTVVQVTALVSAFLDYSPLVGMSLFGVGLILTQEGARQDVLDVWRTIRTSKTIKERRIVHEIGQSSSFWTKSQAYALGGLEAVCALVGFVMAVFTVR